jgi:poly(3-hydroxybutyrate) depolymerase
MSIRERLKPLAAWVRRLFRVGPLKEREGYFDVGSKWSWRGWLSIAPWVPPTREYLLYVPANYSPRNIYPLVIWIHGCKQSPEEFAAGTGVMHEADRRAALVLLPRQARHANPEKCWNWFDGSTTAGYGEAAIVLAQVNEVRRRYRVDKRRIYVAGLSSGGGLAAVIAVRHPDRIAAAAMHSGVPCGAASSAWTAPAALRSGPNREVEGIGLVARHNARPDALPVPALVIHGSGDTRVHAENARRLVTQFLALNGDERAMVSNPQLPEADGMDTVEEAETTHPYLVYHYLKDGADIVRYVAVDGLEHAWSGGDDAYPYQDGMGPGATALIFDFFADRAKARRPLSFLARIWRR